MKKLTVLFFIITTIGMAGTIKNPTKIKDGESYEYQIDETKNYYYFYLKEKTNFYAAISRGRTDLQYLFVKPKIAIYSDKMKKICTNNGLSKEINCDLYSGAYILQVQTGMTVRENITMGTLTISGKNIQEKEPEITIKIKD